MRFILKGPEPQSFIDWKKLENDDWKPTFDVHQNPEKLDVKRSLLSEQHYICCYCEKTVDETNSHIEHLAAQSSVDGKQRTVDYSNLLCSCLKETERGQPLTCGKARDNWNSPDFITPLERACADNFSYDWEGNIIAQPLGNSRAEKTIDKLNLNGAILCRTRKNVLDIILSVGDIEKQSLLAISFVTPNHQDRYDPGFPSMIAYLFHIS